MAVHEATFECFVAHLNELVERVGYVAPGTPLQKLAPEEEDDVGEESDPDYSTSKHFQSNTLLRILPARASQVRCPPPPERRCHARR